jgi:hypothetical protein
MVGLRETGDDDAVRGAYSLHHASVRRVSKPTIDEKFERIGYP